VNEVPQPLVDPAAPVGSDAPSLNGSRRKRPEWPRVAFPELVLAHYDWRKAVEEGRPSRELESAYSQKLQSFEREHGRIVNAYWCLSVPSAVALTEKPRPRALRLFGMRPTPAFHRVTDWATRRKPSVAAALHQCDELAIRVTQVLTGLRRRIALQMVMASACHLLSVADRAATLGDGKDVLDRELDEEHGNLKNSETYYCDAANGQTQMVYFVGMGVFAFALGLLALPALFLNVPGVEDREFFGALVAGAIGAVVSVVARINSGRFDVEYDVGRAYPFFLGGLRPLMGGAFGLVLYFAISSGLLEILRTSEESTERFYGILVISFAAGFSERWAKDTLAVATGGVTKGKPDSTSDAERAP
jgi:hypothetical protein